jgi:putative aldouronate transport system substrate-binding protein
MLPILNGSIDISELPKAQKKLEDAGYLKIVAEAKKQVDEFLVSKK